MRGGWVDRNRRNGIPDGPDELLVDIFTPGTQTLAASSIFRRPSSSRGRPCRKAS